MKQTLRILVFTVIAFPSLALSSGAQGAGKGPAAALDSKARAATVRVNCNAGETITDALEKKPGRDLVIVFRGTCVELITITRSSLTLVGQSEEATVSGGILVSHADNVTLRRFSMADSGGDGIVVAEGSSASIENVSIQGIGGSGVVAEASRLSLQDVSVIGVGGVGLLVIENSSISVSGDLSVTDNGNVGILVGEASSIVLSNFNLDVSRNFFGIVIQTTSTGLFTGGLIRAVENDIVGILVAGGAVLVEGFTETEATGNGFAGGAATDSSSWVNFAGTDTRRVITGNGGIGIRVESDSALDFRGSESEISDNGDFGIILANGQGQFEGISASGQSMGDLFLEFGSKALFVGTNDIATVACDGTELISGDVACTGAAAPAAAAAKVAPVRLGPLQVPGRSRR